LVSAIPFSSLLLPAKQWLSIPVENGKREKKKTFSINSRNPDKYHGEIIAQMASAQTN
jgi:hypothetical protein